MMRGGGGGGGGGVVDWDACQVADPVTSGAGDRLPQVSSVHVTLLLIWHHSENVRMPQTNMREPSKHQVIARKNSEQIIIFQTS
ncbi:hypothetical protein ACJX0J_033830, partial [Zea mays]